MIRLSRSGFSLTPTRNDDVRLKSLNLQELKIVVVVGAKKAVRCGAERRPLLQRARALSRSPC
jgi:hypothetical protein